VAGQTIHYRPQKGDKPSKEEHSAAKLKRDRESGVWGIVIDQVGPPPEEVEWIHVLDRGGDNFEVYCHLLEQRSGWVVRAGRLNRYVLAGPDEKRMPLSDYLPQLTLLGTYELSLRARPKQAARTAKLEVRVGSIRMPIPHHKSPWVRALDPEPIAMNVVYVVEVDPPVDVEPISWVLLTSLPVDTFDQAMEWWSTDFCASLASAQPRSEIWFIIASATSRRHYVQEPTDTENRASQRLEEAGSIRHAARPVPGPVRCRLHSRVGG
jgi:hypothetical protein